MSLKSAMPGALAVLTHGWYCELSFECLPHVSIHSGHNSCHPTMSCFAISAPVLEASPLCVNFSAHSFLVYFQIRFQPRPPVNLLRAQAAQQNTCWNSSKRHLLWYVAATVL